MHNGFSLDNLDLSGVQAAMGASVLPPGRYVCTIKGVKLGDTKARDGSKMLEVSLHEVNNKGVITARLNVHNVKSQEATRIGLEQLKALATHAGAVDVNRPFAEEHGGVNALNGNIVGVVVKAERYNGEDRSQVSGFCDPSTVKGYESVTPSAIGDSDVPF